MTEIPELAARADLYAALAGALAYPEAAVQAAFASGSFLKRVQEAIVRLPGRERLLASARSLQAALDALALGPGGLESEHTRLFARQVQCPPNEASYGSDQSFGGVSQIADVASFYAAFGFRVAPEAKQLPDHVCVELEFLAALCAKEAYAREQGWADRADLCARAREKFLREHLGQWFSAFAARVREHARLPFYPAVVALAEAGLSLDPACAPAPSAS